MRRFLIFKPVPYEWGEAVPLDPSAMEYIMWRLPERTHFKDAFKEVVCE